MDGILTGYRKARGTTNIFNIGLQELTSVDRVSDLVIQGMRLSGVRKKYTGGARGWIGDNPIVHLDVSKLKSLGWSPKVSVEEAINKTIKWTIAHRFDEVN